jgi:hypothetical protein
MDDGPTMRMPVLIELLVDADVRDARTRERRDPPHSDGGRATALDRNGS